jgi:hypothetical protein
VQYPPFLEHLLSGNDSRRDRRFRARSRLRCQREICRLSENSRTISRRRSRGSSRFEIRADNRRFRDLEVSGQPLLPREGRSLRPPIFRKPLPVWQNKWARQADQGTIQAGMVWRRSRQFRTNFGRVHGGFPESRSGFVLGESGGRFRDLMGVSR